jgi:hypothetical protein
MKRPKFRLRTLFLLLFVVAVVVGDLVEKLNFARAISTKWSVSNLHVTTTVWIPFYLRIEGNSRFTRKSFSCITFFGKHILLEESTTIVN